MTLSACLIRSIRRAAAAVVLCAASAAPLAAAATRPAARPAGPAVVTPAPAGGYATAWLTLAGGATGDKGAPLDVPLFLGLRNGKAVVAWFAHPALSGQRRMWLDESTLAADGTALKGELRGRAQLGADRGDKARSDTLDYVYAINCTVAADGTLAGSFRATLTPPDGKPARPTLTGKVAGSLRTEPQLLARDAVPADQEWPGYFGPTGAFRQPAGAARLVDDLSKARLVWKSEAWVPTSYGNATDMRYADRGGYVAPGGGSSSPVVAGGVVYQYHYRPSPDAPLAAKTFAGRTIDNRRADAKRLYAREVEGRWYLDLFREAADDVVVAMDAATGRTLWTAVMPQRSPNVQTHKMRGLMPVPRVADGVVYAPGFGGRLYALDAKTGNLQWEWPDANPAAATPAAGAQDAADAGTPSPVLAAGVLVHATGKSLVGLDPRSGQQLWLNKSPVGVIHPWSTGGRDRLVVTAVDRRPKAADPKKIDEVTVVHLLDPATGQSLWKADTEFNDYQYLPLIEGDLLLGYDFGKWNANAIGGGRALCYRLRSDGVEKVWQTPLPAGTDSYGLTAGNGQLYVSAYRETLCLDLTTGKVIANIPGPGGARTQVMFAAGDRVFTQPEGRHGKLGFLMIDPAANRQLPASEPNGTSQWPGQWYPPIVHTTAYAQQPIVFPVVDGRMFVRGGDAIYCFDLRKP